MSQIEQRVRAPRRRQRGQGASRLPRRGEGGNDKEADRQRDIHTHARCCCVRNSRPDIDTRHHDQQKGGELRETQLHDQPIRRRDIETRGGPRKPSECYPKRRGAESESADCFGHDRRQPRLGGQAFTTGS